MIPRPIRTRAWSRTALSVLLAASLLPRLACAGADVGDPRRARADLDESNSMEVVKREFGILLGTPGAMNLEAGYWPNRVFGARASGMYFGQAFWGLQGNLCVTTRRGPHSRVAIAAVGGTHREYDTHWNYVGAALDWNAEPFFAELGPVVLESNDPNYQSRHFAVVAQVGVMGGGGTRGPR